MGALRLIYSKLIQGEMFGKIDQLSLGGTYFWEVLAIRNGFIKWRHYGSSSNKININSLKWIIEKIFNMSPEEFLYEYTTYTEWKRINSCYDQKTYVD